MLLSFWYFFNMYLNLLGAGKIQHRKVFFCWIVIFLLGCGVYFYVSLNMGGVFYFFWLPHVCQSRAGFVWTRILSCKLWRMSVLKFHWDVKEEAAESRNAAGLWLSSFLKERANHLCVNLSVLIYNSTPVGIIPAPLPRNWQGKCKRRPSMYPSGILRDCSLPRISKMFSVDPFLCAIF